MKSYMSYRWSRSQDILMCCAGCAILHISTSNEWTWWWNSSRADGRVQYAATVSVTAMMYHCCCCCCWRWRWWWWWRPL